MVDLEICAGFEQKLVRNQIIQASCLLYAHFDFAREVNVVAVSGAELKTRFDQLKLNVKLFFVAEFLGNNRVSS